MNRTTPSADCRTCSQKKIDYNKTVLVRQMAELTVFHALFPKYDSILLKFDELTKDENERWGDKLFANYSACGCTTGAYFMLTGFILTLLYAALSLKIILSNPMAYVLKGFTIWVVAALVGKLVGLIFAKIRLFVQLGKLKAILKQRSLANTHSEMLA